MFSTDEGEDEVENSMTPYKPNLCKFSSSEDKKVMSKQQQRRGVWSQSEDDDDDGVVIDQACEELSLCSITSDDREEVKPGGTNEECLN